MKVYRGDYFGDTVLVLYSYSYGNYSFSIIQDYVIEFDHVLIERNEKDAVKRL